MKSADKYPAKINRLVFKNILERKRLFNVLDREDGEQLIWICGPAGFGKTTLISSYIDHKNLPCIWYQWDSGDWDPASFYYYFSMACQREITRGKEALPSFTPEWEKDLEAFSRFYFETLFGSMSSPSLIVFDNLIQVPRKYFLDLLSNAISRMPPGIRVAVINRSEPPPALSILSIRNQMKVLGVEDMRLDPEEFRQAARLYGIEGVPEETLNIMHQRVEGWFAGLMLLAESFKRAGFDPDKFVRSNARELYAFFAGEIDRTLDDETRNFLLKTSFLNNITVQSAHLLTGYDRCEEVLDYLTSNNLFIARRDTDPPSYQYHSLFREYLQRQADRNMSADELADVKSRAASILKDAGQLEHATLLLAGSEVWDELALMISESAEDMLRHGRHHLLEEWILSIPEEVFARDRYLQFWLGSCRFPFSPKVSRPYFLKSLEMARDAGDAEIAYRSWSAAVESVIFEFNDLHELDGLIEELPLLREQFPRYPTKTVEAATVGAMLAALVFRQLEHPEIEKWAREAVSIALEGSLENQILVGLVEAMRHFYMGQMVDMRVTVETLVEPFEMEDVCLSLCTLVHYLLAMKEWTLVNLKACREFVEKGLKTADRTGVHVWDLLLLGQGAMCVLADGDTGAAQDYLQEMKRLLPRASKHDQSHYHYLSAWAATLDGDNNQARSHARRACDLKKEVGNPYGIGSNRLALAQTMWSGGDREQAKVLLEESKRTADQTKSGLLFFLYHITETRFALDEGEMERAVQSLKFAFTLGAAYGIYNFFWLDKHIMSRLCSLALEENIMVGYAQELIRKHNIVPDMAARELEAWPWPVKLYTLGRFELVIKGKKIKFPRKSQERPMSLLKAIVALGGRKVDAYHLAEALWPDSDGVTGQQTLATTLHRLRKLLGVDEAVIFSKNNVSLNPELVWVDVWAVERALGRINPALEDGSSGEEGSSLLLPRIEKALELYKGHFLNQDGSESWCITPRERLRSKFIRNLMDYCSWLEQQGEETRAIRWYLKALEMDNLSEKLYQGLMLCYGKIGQKADALATYNRCRQVLGDVLGVEPSKETEKIRDALLEDA